MLKRLIFLVVVVMAIAASYSAVANAFKNDELVVHWEFDNNLLNSGTAGQAYNLSLPTPSPSDPPMFTTGLGSSGALAFNNNNTNSLGTVMAQIAPLSLTDATVSFNLKQGSFWNHYLILADSTEQILTLYIDGSFIHSATTTDPIAVLKNATATKTWSIVSSSLSSGAIDDFRVYNYVLDSNEITNLSQPALFDRVNTDHSTFVTIGEIVSYMHTLNISDHALTARLLDLIKPINPIQTINTAS